MTHLPREIIENKLETMLLQFLDVDVDIREEPMEVAPTAHHFMGGALINEHCMTSIKNLYAAGEATGGVHGANRLGGNALADTQVFGRRAGESAAQNALNTESTFNMEQAILEKDRIQSLFNNGDYYPFEIKNELEEVMWNHVAIIRNAEGLKIAREKINELKGRLSNLKVSDVGVFNKDLQDALEIEMMLNIADLVAKSALIREESRGAHYRSDYPKTRDEWKKSIVLNKDKDIRFIRR